MFFNIMGYIFVDWNKTPVRCCEEKLLVDQASITITAPVWNEAKILDLIGSTPATQRHCYEEVKGFGRKQE